jgi:CheY-like chemotaxis protein
MLGIDHYMVKPVESRVLIEKLKSSFIHLGDDSSSVSLENVKKELRILVVEDNRMNQLILIKMLKSLGYECDMAEDGYEGFTKGKTGNYDIIFMDLLLPEMDGFEASRRISENDKKVIIVAFTADIMLDTKRKAEMSGIKDFVSKPVNIDDLKKLFVRYFSIE